eukprot:scpid81172/ scgid23471/ 
MNFVITTALILLLAVVELPAREHDFLAEGSTATGPDGEGQSVGTAMVLSGQTSPAELQHGRRRRGLGRKMSQALKAMGEKIHRGGKAAWKKFKLGLKNGGKVVLKVLASKTGRKITTGLGHASNLVSVICCTVGSVAFPVAGVPCCAAMKIVKGVITGVGKVQGMACRAKKNCRRHSPDMQLLTNRDVTNLRRDVVAVRTAHRACGAYGGRREAVMDQAIRSTLSALSDDDSRTLRHSSSGQRYLSQSESSMSLRMPAAYFTTSPLDVFRPARFTMRCRRREVAMANRLRQRLADHAIRAWRQVAKRDMPDHIVRGMKVGAVEGV